MAHETGKLKTLTVGVDAGATTGIAVWSENYKLFRAVFSTDFKGAVRFFAEWTLKEMSCVVVEIPPKFTYARNDVAAGRARDAKQKMQAGNRREAECLAAVLEVFGYEVARVAPVRAAKWTPEQLRRYTGYEKRTNEHMRDAARLAFLHAGKNHR